MEFLLLGPVEVRAAGRLVDSGGPRQRSVLAALAVDVGRSVLTDTLIDRVWGSAPPDRARHALHVYVGRIREMLRNPSAADGVPARLVRGSGGYRLEVDPDCVDMYQFRRMVNEARDPSAPDSARSVLLRRALDLWRGAPLADLSGEWAAQMREGWRQHRIDAVLRWAQVELELDNPGAVAGPLTDVLGDYPLDESLAATLMRALAAAGRSADALSCYATMRQRLVEELGVEPGEDLRRVHLTILRGDSPARRADEPSVITAAGSDARGPAPAELPTDIADFTGRTEEIQRLVDALGSKGPRASGQAVAISVLAGRAGVGKTALAVHVGHRLRAEFPDGQLYADLRGADRDPVEPAATLTRFCRALGVNDTVLPRTVDDLAACYRSHTADRRMLVVLDNVASEAQVRPLLPGSHGCAVIVTSRHRLTALPGAYLEHLDGLEPEQAVGLLARVAGTDRVARQPTAARQVARLCGHLPLALRVTGARLAARPHWDLATAAIRLADERRRLDELVHADLDVRASLALSYRGLSPAARATLRRLVLIDLPTVTTWTAAALNGDDAHIAAEPTMDELANTYLIDAASVDSTGATRYRLHDLTRVFAAERADSDEPSAARAIAIERMLDWYEVTCGAANAVLAPRRNRVSPAARHRLPGTPFEPAEPAVTAWVDDEWENIKAAIRFAVDHGHDASAWHLAYFTVELADRRGRYADSLELALYVLPAVERLRDPVALGLQLSSVSIACTRLRRFDEALALLHRCLDARRAAGDRRGEGVTWNNVGIVYHELHRIDESIDAYERAYAVGVEVDNRGDMAIATNNIGVGYRMLGDFDRSLVYLRKSLDARRQLGDRHGEAVTMAHLGETYAALGDHEAALRCFHDCLAMDAGDRPLTGETTRQIGLIYQRRGDHERAFEHVMLAAEIHDGGDMHYQAMALTDAGLMRLRCGDLDDARRLIDRAVALRRQVPDPVEEDRLRLATAELSARRP